MSEAFCSLNSAHAEEIAELHRLGFETPWREESIRELLELPTSFTLGVTAGKQAVLAGFAMFQCAGDEAEILTITVAPEWRQKGFARALMTNADIHLAARGCHRLLLDVAEDNEPAIALYKSMDFQVDGKRPKYYSRAKGRWSDAVMMSRAITGLPQ
ncbi:MAG: ribosomal protein S18-alanine N-acetyltransferase [Pseudomonadota bacterium]